MWQWRFGIKTKPSLPRLQNGEAIVAPKTPIKIVKATTFEAAALLRLSGLIFIGAEVQSGRAVLGFEDPEQLGAQLLLRHEQAGIPVNSLDFESAMRWAKDRAFAARRAGGLD